MQIPKKIILISNTESDTFYQAMLQQSHAPQMLFLKTEQYGKRSIQGDLMESIEAQTDLLAF